MAVRDDFAAGEVLAAADLNDTFASKLDLAGGKILQIVRATDGTDRSSTSTTPVDITGMSVTITPQLSNSSILVIVTAYISTQNTSAADKRGTVRLTDSSNNPLAGAISSVGIANFSSSGSNGIVETPLTLIGYSTPATTSATTYKAQWYVNENTTTIYALNSVSVGQLYAIEVSA